MVLLSILITIAVLALFVLIGSYIKGKNDKKGWLQFYTKGKEIGFTFKETEHLRLLSLRCNLEDPMSVFWSQEQLDICIRSLVHSSHITGKDQDQETQDLISKLYDYRKKIGLEKPLFQTGLSSSRQVEEAQPLRILLSGVGVFKSQVIKNTSQYITIARPVQANLPQNFSWTGQRLAVYFWRNDDAGYVFDADVHNEVYSKGLAALLISHSDSLFRTQKRQSNRLKTHKPAYLYILSNGFSAEGLESIPGLKCIMEDLSDGGCAITIGGKANVGLRVKIQFVLDNIPLSMSGTVRSIDFRENVKQSLLHIQADPLPVETRNQILGEVFGMAPEEDEPLSFRDIEEELAEDGAALETN
ncbi:MAG: PilZ domain-containing protein [Treponema sp.]|jgi:c-di-GMP-binding flagellar brake protein YcgR|nr:PilZ domain-containing protein [Treponema sp.]